MCQCLFDDRTKIFFISKVQFIAGYSYLMRLLKKKINKLGCIIVHFACLISEDEDK